VKFNWPKTNLVVFRSVGSSRVDEREGIMSKVLLDFPSTLSAHELGFLEHRPGSLPQPSFFDHRPIRRTIFKGLCVDRQDCEISSLRYIFAPKRRRDVVSCKLILVSRDCPPTTLLVFYRRAIVVVHLDDFSAVCPVRFPQGNGMHGISIFFPQSDYALALVDLSEAIRASDDDDGCDCSTCAPSLHRRRGVAKGTPL
jgi:hypothetical protein